MSTAIKVFLEQGLQGTKQKPLAGSKSQQVILTKTASESGPFQADHEDAMYVGLVPSSDSLCTKVSVLFPCTFSLFLPPSSDLSPLSHAPPSVALCLPEELHCMSS